MWPWWCVPVEVRAAPSVSSRRTRTERIWDSRTARACSCASTSESGIWVDLDSEEGEAGERKK